jgi:hypothetical protein
MEAKAKERPHRLVDQIPEGEVHTAERFLEYLTTADDPVLRALMNAPVDDEPSTDDEREVAGRPVEGAVGDWKRAHPARRSQIGRS